MTTNQTPRRRRRARRARRAPEPRKPLVSQRALLLVVAAVGAGLWAASSPAAGTAITVAAAVLVLLNGMTGE